MKIFYAARLFSGLEDSFTAKEWNPSGVPTIYRIIEEMDRNHTPCFFFTAKDNGEGCFSLWNETKDKYINISGLRAQVHIITGIGFFPVWMGVKTRMVLREIRQFFSTIIGIIKFKPDIIYCDHANVFMGAVLSRVQTKIPIVFRVMGVDGFMRQCLTSDNFIQKIYRWAYKSPFDMVLCTQDGSGVESWMDSALLQSVRREVLLNGVDIVTLPDTLDQKLLDVPNKKLVILFIGKLEKYKGCYEFVRSILLLLKNQYVNIHALIIGVGGEESSLKKIVKEAGMDSYFTFIEGLPHEQIFAAHSISDVYVSMNYFGNLSNANLEAIQSNDCIVMPNPQGVVDSFTSILLKDGVVKVPIKSHIELFIALSELLESKEKRLQMSHSISIIKRDFLWSWRERIDAEMNLLQEISSDSIYSTPTN